MYKVRKYFFRLIVINFFSLLYLIDTISLNKVSGQPYTSLEILDKIKEILN